MNISHAFEARRELVSCGNENPWAIRNPLDEARDLHRMVVHGSCTVESIRDLISVPADIEAALLAYADRYPKDGERIHCVLQFRRKVGLHFETLVQGLPFIEGPRAETESEAEQTVQPKIVDETDLVPVLTTEL